MAGCHLARKAAQRLQDPAGEGRRFIWEEFFRMIDMKTMELIKKSSGKSLTEAEVIYCRNSGLLIDHESVTHDEAVAKIHMLAEKISLEATTKSFLYSISSGDCRYRTILSSLIWAKMLPVHDCEISDQYRCGKNCSICGLKISEENGKAEFNELEYVRLRLFPSKKFMDTCSAGYVLHDLLAFRNLPAVEFFDEDLRTLRRILGLAEQISPTNKVNALLKLVSADQSLALTAADAYSIMGVLASCGVYDTPEYKSYARGFVRCDEREFVYETDIYYPLHLWRGKNGINYAAIEAFFGELTAGKLAAKHVIRGKVEREEKALTTNTSKAEVFFKDGEHVIDMDNRQRYYFGLAPMDPTWDRIVIYSATHNNMKRSEIFFDGDRIKKIVFEQKRIDYFEYYMEADMDVATRSRRMILPKTDRGREHTITPSLLMTPTHMHAQLHVYLNGRSAGAWTFNSSNDQALPLPSTNFETREDFARFAEEYIASCPSDYRAQLDRFIHKKRVKVRFTAGDIFRAQISTTQYTYGLILGKVRQLEKWPEIPKGHPIMCTMTQPLLIRQYDIITTNPHMTAEELSLIPLMHMHLAQDNEILWATYPIVCHKDLAEEDIDLGFGINSRLRTIIWGLSMHTFDEKSWSAAGFEDTHAVGICSQGDGKSTMTYGVFMGIQIDSGDGENDYILPRKEHEFKQKEMVTRLLGLDPENACDDFARRYGGITRKKYIEFAKTRYKK